MLGGLRVTSCGMVFASSVPQRGRDPHSAPVLPRGHRRALLHGDGEGRRQGITVLKLRFRVCRVPLVRAPAGCFASALL